MRTLVEQSNKLARARADPVLPRILRIASFFIGHHSHRIKSAAHASVHRQCLLFRIIVFASSTVLGIHTLQAALRPSAVLQDVSFAPQLDALLGADICDFWNLLRVRARKHHVVWVLLWKLSRSRRHTGWTKCWWYSSWGWRRTSTWKPTYRLHWKTILPAGDRRPPFSRELYLYVVLIMLHCALDGMLTASQSIPTNGVTRIWQRVACA